MKDEALKLALEALEFFKGISLSMNEIERAEQAITAINQALAAPVQPEQEPVATYTCGVCGISMSMETTLSAPVTPFEEAVAAVDNTLHYAIDHWQDRALKAEAKLAQPEQEPVAWMFQHGETGRMSFVSNDGMNNPELFLAMNPRYALVCALVTPPAAQQIDEAHSAGYSNGMTEGYEAGKAYAAARHQCKWPTCQSEEYQQALAEQINQELVTGAAQRKPLTDEQLNEIADRNYSRWFEFARAIEAAHGIKENT